MRLLSAQMQAYLDGDLAQRAPGQCHGAAPGGRHGPPGVALQGRADANILFCRLPAAAIDSLLAQGFGFYHDRWGPGIVRLVTSFATREQDVDHFIGTARRRGARMTLPA